MRNQKNLSIAGITLATRAAIEGGVLPEIAYNLSDLYIQKLEELESNSDITLLTSYAIMELTERVKKGQKHKYSRPINLCHNYIFNHLYESITLASLGKEVGISVVEYIHQLKIEEAKSLLTFTNYSSVEISGLLNFHDQSYFSKVFRKHTGVTPKQYKKG